MSLPSNDPSNDPVQGKPSIRLDQSIFSMRPTSADRKTLLEAPATNHSGELTIAQRAAFQQKIAMIGYGVYGQAIHSRLPDHDIVPWERASTSRESSDLATTDLSKAINGRGLLILAVPANAFPNVLNKIRPHPDSVVVSLAKGLIVPNWNPLESERSLRDGPPEGSNA
ncbi:MAG: NAD(P)-binding domain-containing protein, partial [Proteobacteria bacterium]|nr:NAD(P)-binding domain-containing protein [Pseudomonadota bacterium]